MMMIMTFGLVSSKNISYGILKQIFPLGFPRDQTPQGQFYCSVGAKNAFGRDIIEEHLDQCLDAGLNVEGINAEVAAGQWEYQIFSKGAKNAGDEIWVSRYLAERNAEKYGLSIEWHPKPLGATDWNGSGMHANFQIARLESVETKKFSIKYVKLSVKILKNTWMFTEHIMSKGLQVCMKLSLFTSFRMESQIEELQSEFQSVQLKMGGKDD